MYSRPDLNLKSGGYIILWQRIQFGEPPALILKEGIDFNVVG
jgi:hypothetical protein